MDEDGTQALAKEIGDCLKQLRTCKKNFSDLVQVGKAQQQQGTSIDEKEEER
jgi:hypothetical protein